MGLKKATGADGSEPSVTGGRFRRLNASSISSARCTYQTIWRIPIVHRRPEIADWAFAECWRYASSRSRRL